MSRLKRLKSRRDFKNERYRLVEGRLSEPGLCDVSNTEKVDNREKVR